MAARIRHSNLARLCGRPAFARQTNILGGVRAFSGTRVSSHATETTPTHAFSNGQNLGSISLKRNGIHLENKLRIVSGNLSEYEESY